MKKTFPVNKYDKTLAAVISLLMAERAVCGEDGLIKRSMVQMLLVEIVYGLGVITHIML